MEEKDSDLIVIREVIQGNQMAFKSLVAKYTDYAYNLAFRLVNERFEAEEIVQDSFLKVYRSLNSFKMQSRFSTWLYTIVYRESINHLKKKKFYTEEINDKVELMAIDPDTKNGFEQLENEDRKRFVKQALCILKPKESAVLTLFYLEEQTLKEIGTIMDMQAAHVKVILHRGRKNLLEKLQSLSAPIMNELL